MKFYTSHHQAARLHPFVYTHKQLRLLFGRSADPDARRLLQREPFEQLTSFEVDLLCAWHTRRTLSTETMLHLAAEYAKMNDYAPRSAAETMRVIARRAGVPAKLRVPALEICVCWTGRGGESIRLMTKRNPTHEDVYVAFDAEATKFLETLHNRTAH